MILYEINRARTIVKDFKVLFNKFTSDRLRENLRYPIIISQAFCINNLLKLQLSWFSNEKPLQSVSLVLRTPKSFSRFSEKWGRCTLQFDLHSSLSSFFVKCAVYNKYMILLRICWFYYSNRMYKLYSESAGGCLVLYCTLRCEICSYLIHF